MNDRLGQFADQIFEDEGISIELNEQKPSATIRAMMAGWRQLNPKFPKGKLPYFWEGDHLHLKTVR
jgi:hypothetical protein